MNPDSTAAATSRRYDLDWLRVGAFTLLIAYHIGMFYVSWDWHIKSRFITSGIEPLMMLVNPWRLPLLFLISGMALRFSLEKLPARSLARQRLLRIGVPLLFGFFVVCAPQSYFELLQNGEIGPDFWAFYVQYLDFDFEFSILTPSWNHLWYLVYLLLYTLIICAASKVLSRVANRAERLPGSLLLLLPPVLFLLSDAMLADHFPVTHALVDDWYTHAISFTAMLFGYLVACSARFWSAVQRSTIWACAAVVVLGALILQRATAPAGGAILPQDTVGAVRLVYGWLTILALLGIARRHLDRKSALLAYLGPAMMPYYVLHQTLIVSLGALATALELPFASELWLITVGTIAGCVIGYELIRRVPLLRLLFGAPPSARPSTAYKPAVASSGH